jgi:hypothetical protein
VAGAALLGRAVAFGVLLVVLAQVFLADLDVLGKRFEIQHQVLDLGALGRHEGSGVRGIVVVSRDLGVGRLDLVGVRLGLEARNAHFAPLQQRIEGDVGRRGGAGRGVGHAEQHLTHRQVLAQLLSELLGAHALGGQQVGVDAAVGLAQEGELRVVHEHALQAIVADVQAQLGGGHADDALAHQALERLLLHLRRVEQLDVDVGRLRAHALDLRTVGRIPLGLHDGLPGHLGDLDIAFPEAAVALDAEKHEGGNDQHHQHEHHCLGVPANHVEHRKASEKQLRFTCDKGEPRFAFAGDRRSGPRGCGA